MTRKIGFRFGLRFLLIAFLLVSILMGWLARLNHIGESRLDAAEKLRGYGVIVAESSLEIKISSRYMMIIDGEYVPFGTEAKHKEMQKEGLLRTIFGNTMFDEYNILFFHIPVKHSAAEIQTQIDRLEIETIYVHESVSQDFINSLESLNPRIEFKTQADLVE